MTYDEKSYELAEFFLRDEPAIDTPNNRDALAKAIQSTIEDFIATEKDE